MDCSGSQHLLLNRAIANIAIGTDSPQVPPSDPPPTPPSSCPSPSQLGLARPELPFFHNTLKISNDMPSLSGTDSELYQNIQSYKTLSTAIRVLSTEAAALSCLSTLYTTNSLCCNGMVRAVETIVESQKNGGKNIIIGIGKSGKIGDKLVASMNSLGLMSVFLNPVEALHGDLGIVRENDVLLMITFSGSTPELLQLMPHLPVKLPLIVLTSHMSYRTLPLVKDRENAILLPTPTPESEVESFGLAAPTTSTIVAMALGDALALSAAYRIHNVDEMGPREVFKKNHPGGAIGMAEKAARSKDCNVRIRELAIRWAEIPVARIEDIVDAEIFLPSPAISETSSESGVDIEHWGCDSAGNNTNYKSIQSCTNSSRYLRVLDCLRIAIKGPRGWLRTPGGGIIPPKKLARCQSLMSDINSPQLDLVVDLNDELLVRISADAEIKDVARMLCSRRATGEVSDETVVAIVEDGKIFGVLEVHDVIERSQL